MIRFDEAHYVADVFDALRAVTVDKPGSLVSGIAVRHEMRVWLLSNGRTTAPTGAMNRVMAHAGYTRSGCSYRNLALR